MSSHQSNVGALDATVRVLAGIPIVFAGPVAAVNMAPDWGAVIIPLAFMTGGLLIMTGSLRYDPAYSMMGINTAKR